MQIRCRKDIPAAGTIMAKIMKMQPRSADGSDRGGPADIAPEVAAAKRPCAGAGEKGRIGSLIVGRLQVFAERAEDGRRQRNP